MRLRDFKFDIIATIHNLFALFSDLKKKPILHYYDHGHAHYTISRVYIDPHV